MRLRRFLQARQPTADDAGFTLVEVIVALVLLTMVATAAFALFIHVLQSSKGMDSRAAAITVAQQAMDNARSVSPGFDASNHSKMVDGRQQSLVTAQFGSPPVGVDVSQTYPDYDAAAVGTSTPVIPMTSTVTVSNQTFNVATIIGQCVLTKSTGACGKTVAGATPPALTALAAGTTLVERVIVSVTWTNQNACATALACSYTVATLIDPASNPQFSVYILRANDDIYSDPCSVSSPTSYTCVASLAVLSNDSGKFGVNAVNQVTAPAHGSLNTLSVNGNPAVTYTPTDCTSATNAYSGVDTFQYNATDIHGDTTNTALVTVTVAAPAAPTVGSTTPTWSLNAQSAAATQSLATAIPSGSVGAWCSQRPAVTNLTLGSTNPIGAGITLTASGMGSTSGINVGTPAGWSGTASFTYKLTDAFGQVSPVLTGSLAVLPTTPAIVGSVNENVTSTSNNSVTANPVGVGSLLTYAIATNPSLGVASMTGSTLTYKPAVGWPGGTTSNTDTYTYRATDAAGQTTTATVTITVIPPAPSPPVATALKLSSCPARKSTFTFNFGTTYASNATFYTAIGAVPLTATNGNVIGSSISVSGLVVTYKTGTLPPLTGNTLFSFYLTDANGGQSSTVSFTC